MARSIKLQPDAIPTQDAGQPDLGPGTLQAAPPPLTAQPAAAPPGDSNSQIAAPDLQQGTKPGELAGQQPTPSASAPEASSSRRFVQNMNDPDFVKAMEDFGDRHRARAQQLYQQLDPGFLASPEARLQAYKIANDAAKDELSTAYLATVQRGQIAGAGQELAREKEADTREHQKATEATGAQNANTRAAVGGAQIEKYASDEALAPYKLMIQSAGAGSRETAAQARMIYANAAARGVDQGIISQGIQIEQHIRDMAQQGTNAGEVKGVMDFLDRQSPVAASLARQALGVGAPSAATAAGQAAFQRATAAAGGAPPTLPPPAAPPPAPAGGPLPTLETMQTAQRAGRARAGGGAPIAAGPPLNPSPGARPLGNVALPPPGPGTEQIGPPVPGQPPAMPAPPQRVPLNPALGAPPMPAYGGAAVAPPGPTAGRQPVQPVSTDMNKPANQASLVKKWLDAGWPDQGEVLTRIQKYERLTQSEKPDVRARAQDVVDGKFIPAPPAEAGR